MREIGVFEAKTRLSELLEKVATGEEFVITRRGRAIARLVPADRPRAEEIRQAVLELSRFPAGRELGGDWKLLRDSGRKW